MGETVRSNEERGAPAAPGERHDAIDVLRGLALFGVLAINLEYEFRVSIFHQFLPSAPQGAVNEAIGAALNLFISMKAFALFSLLFGVGLAIQYERLAQHPQRAVLLVRRLLILLVFGVIHMFLIWNGDILTEYAIAGLIVLPFLYGPRWLLIAASVICLVLYIAPPIPVLDGFFNPDALTQRVQEANSLYGSGDFWEILSFRIQEIPAILPLHVAIFPRTLALMFFGALTWRLGLYAGPRGSRWQLWMAAVGIGGGLALTLAAHAQPIGDVALAIGYWALVIAAMKTSVGRRLLGWARVVGRMAFTNYVMQSLVLGFVFYGYGLGLFNRLDVAFGLTIVIALYAAQAAASALWLKHYRFGPLEWLWRTLTYGRTIAIRAKHQ